MQATVVRTPDEDGGFFMREPPPCKIEPSEFDWEVVLKRTRTESALGLGLFENANDLIVQSIGPGMLSAWNRAHPELEVRRGAVILAINGKTGDPKTLFERLRNDAFLRLKLKRVPNLEVSIEERGKLGLEVSNNTLEVLQVKENGSIDGHNRTCKPGYQMVPGDKIVCVNGMSGDVPAMLKEMYTSPCLNFTIARDWD